MNITSVTGRVRLPLDKQVVLVSNDLAALFRLGVGKRATRMNVVEFGVWAQQTAELVSKARLALAKLDVLTVADQNRRIAYANNASRFDAAFTVRLERLTAYIQAVPDGQEEKARLRQLYKDGATSTEVLESILLGLKRQGVLDRYIDQLPEELCAGELKTAVKTIPKCRLMAIALLDVNADPSRVSNVGIKTQAFGTMAERLGIPVTEISYDNLPDLQEIVDTLEAIKAGANRTSVIFQIAEALDYFGIKGDSLRAALLSARKKRVLGLPYAKNLQILLTACRSANIDNAPELYQSISARVQAEMSKTCGFEFREVAKDVFATIAADSDERLVMSFTGFGANKREALGLIRTSPSILFEAIFVEDAEVDRRMAALEAFQIQPEKGREIKPFSSREGALVAALRRTPEWLEERAVLLTEKWEVTQAVFDATPFLLLAPIQNLEETGIVGAAFLRVGIERASKLDFSLEGLREAQIHLDHAAKLLVVTDRKGTYINAAKRAQKIVSLFIGASREARKEAPDHQAVLEKLDRAHALCFGRSNKEGGVFELELIGPLAKNIRSKSATIILDEHLKKAAQTERLAALNNADSPDLFSDPSVSLDSMIKVANGLQGVINQKTSKLIIDVVSALSEYTDDAEAIEYAVYSVISGRFYPLPKELRQKLDPIGLAIVEAIGPEVATFQALPQDQRGFAKHLDLAVKMLLYKVAGKRMSTLMAPYSFSNLASRLVKLDLDKTIPKKLRAALAALSKFLLKEEGVPFDYQGPTGRRKTPLLSGTVIDLWEIVEDRVVKEKERYAQKGFRQFIRLVMAKEFQAAGRAVASEPEGARNVLNKFIWGINAFLHKEHRKALGHFASNGYDELFQNLPFADAAMIMQLHTYYRSYVSALVLWAVGKKEEARRHLTRVANEAPISHGTRQIVIGQLAKISGASQSSAEQFWGWAVSNLRASLFDIPARPQAEVVRVPKGSAVSSFDYLDGRDRSSGNDGEIFGHSADELEAIRDLNID